jgi:hypothetical protein
MSFPYSRRELKLLFNILFTNVSSLYVMVKPWRVTSKIAEVSKSSPQHATSNGIEQLQHQLA